MMKLLFSVAGLIGFVILSVEFLILCWVILLFIWNTIYPPPSHFQLSGRAGTGTWKKSSGRVLGSWLCFRQCFEETSCTPPYFTTTLHSSHLVTYFAVLLMWVGWLVLHCLSLDRETIGLQTLSWQLSSPTEHLSPNSFRTLPQLLITIDQQNKDTWMEYFFRSFETFKTGRAITENVIYPVTRVKSQSKEDPYTGRWAFEEIWPAFPTLPRSLPQYPNSGTGIAVWIQQQRGWTKEPLSPLSSLVSNYFGLSWPFWSHLCQPALSQNWEAHRNLIS